MWTNKTLKNKTKKQKQNFRLSENKANNTYIKKIIFDLCRRRNKTYKHIVNEQYLKWQLKAENKTKNHTQNKNKSIFINIIPYIPMEPCYVQKLIR